MKTRPNTYDDEIVRTCKGEYKEFTKHLKNTDIVLDLGAHIGAHTCLISPLVKQVIAYEPDPQNFELLKENTNGLTNVEIYPYAVNDETKMISMYRITKARGIAGHCYNRINTSATSMTKYKGREEFFVGAISFQDVLNKYHPTKIKCDIEGGEYVIFKDPLVIPDSVKEIMFEVHLRGNEREKYKPFEKYLIKHGFEVYNLQRTPILNGGWYRRMLVRRMIQTHLFQESEV